MSKDRTLAYRTILGDHFPPTMEISFVGGDGSRQTLFYEKAGWEVGGELKGLRYGENPGQEAALYKLVNGNLVLGDVKTIKPGKWLASNAELVQSGKHPGKINITDADNALNILRYFHDMPTVAVMKHNNPSGVARRDTLVKAYEAANMADRVAAFGGAIALNRPVDIETASAISEGYSEVVVAPEYEQGAMDIFAKRKNLRVMKIGNIQRLNEWDGEVFLEFKSLVDGGQIVQTSYVPKARRKDDLEVMTKRTPTEKEYSDMLFGWLVQSGITSNSVIYVKDDTTLGIGTGEQDRVGVAKIAVGKAKDKYADRVAWETKRTPYNELPAGEQHDIMWSKDVQEVLKNSCMISDAFFPFPDGVKVGIDMGVTSVIQPGGSLKDYAVIAACDEANVAMVFTGQRSFKH
jgi:phosphoribosylaminoimidazolecarboxamide formyltransferase/IMP cyclohydrolase